MPDQIPVPSPAIDFELVDTSGQPVRLSSFFGSKNVLLVFNRGFV